MDQLQTLTEKVRQVMKNYQKRYPEVKMDRDYLPFKITEEWGECVQAYLMFTERGRQKNKSKEEIRAEFAEEFADVFAYFLLFAKEQEINIEEALEKKWFQYLKE